MLKDDNDQEYCLPFKGPFKGKGQPFQGGMSFLDQPGS